MGIITCRARMMLEAKKDGTSFSSTLTLGRQKCNMTIGELAKLRKTYEIFESSDRNDNLEYRSYADQFFYHYLDVDKLRVLDFSAYEEADIIHDMNYPVPDEFEGSFDVVVDGGTLEHIFNFPKAIENCMKMLRIGGSLFIFSMANNHCGHGFYQFSPELFFRIFQAENGFETKSVILVKHPFPGSELSRKQICFQVKDPATLGRRSTLVTRSPLGIMVHAVKIDGKSVLEQYPQQSDYTSTWRSGGIADREGMQNGWGSLLKHVWESLPLRPKLFIAGLHQLWKCSLKRDKTIYTRWR